MAVGSVSGTVVSTEDLELGVAVSVDHETYIVDYVNQSQGHYVVTLVPTYGPAWYLEVAAEDYTEPMWELA